MARRRAYTPLGVFLNTRFVGRLVRETSGAVSFAYDPAWLEWEHSLPVSLSLPLREDRYIGAPVMAVFDNLLPDNDQIRKRVAERVGAAGIDAYRLLFEIGHDCVGALQFLPEGREPQATDTLTGNVVNEKQIEALLNDLDTAPLGIRKENNFRISIAGAQEKTALLFNEGRWIEPTGTTPTTHIIKPQIGKLPNGMDLSNSVENEYLCLKLLENFGLGTAKTEIARFGERKALIVERFDRLWGKDRGRLIRLPQEDCCQALSVPSTRKYQNEGGPGIVEIMKLLTGSDEPMKDQTVYFKANILFWLIGAPDGHAKNFSVALGPGGRFHLTPLYDVLSVQPTLDARQIEPKDMKLAMRVGKGGHYRFREILGRHFVETGMTAGLSRGLTHRIIEEVLADADTVLEDTGRQLPEGFPMDLFDSIAGGMAGRLRRLDT
jgi:serine/threonine-protein kinase HipA